MTNAAYSSAAKASTLGHGLVTNVAHEFGGVSFRLPGPVGITRLGAVRLIGGIPESALSEPFLDNEPESTENVLQDGRLFHLEAGGINVEPASRLRRHRRIR